MGEVGTHIGLLVRPSCSCHDEPMTPVNNRPCGWRCSVKHREAQQRYYDKRMTDPVFRLREAMRVLRAQRLRAIKRMEEALG